MLYTDAVSKLPHTGRVTARAPSRPAALQVVKSAECTDSHTDSEAAVSAD